MGKEQVLPSYGALSTSALLLVQKGSYERVGNSESQALEVTCLKAFLICITSSSVVESRVVTQLILCLHFHQNTLGASHSRNESSSQQAKTTQNVSDS